MPRTTLLAGCLRLSLASQFGLQVVLCRDDRGPQQSTQRYFSTAWLSGSVPNSTLGR